MVSWRRNLFAAWTSQFLSMVGFSVSLPFAPFYIQALGVTDANAVKFWSGMTVAASAAGLAVMSPVWGLLADRHGRKVMMLRANISGAVILLLMGFAPNVPVFVLLRTVQGMFTGTMTAAVTLVACGTPDNRQGFALGSLSAAVFSGSTAGQFLGGMLADSVGYRSTFLVSSLALFVSAMIVLFTIRETFTREVSEGRGGTLRQRYAALGPGTALLVLVAYAAMARRLDGPFLPLYVQELHGRLEGAARWTGLLNAVAGIGAMVSGVIVGHLCDRSSPERLGRLAAVGNGVGMLLTAGCWTLSALFPLRFLAIFFAGSIDPILNAWISRATPASRKGAVFGLAVTAKSLGWIAAPMLGTLIAMHLGTRWVFAAAGVLSLLMVPVIGVVSTRLESRRNAEPRVDTEGEPAPGA
ncbi:MAG: MFS transporter [Lentisphaeria bacterium]|nr:MFS transporter [Lentisphaeria bacterium]